MGVNLIKMRKGEESFENDLPPVVMFQLFTNLPISIDDVFG